MTPILWMLMGAIKTIILVAIAILLTTDLIYIWNKNKQ